MVPQLLHAFRSMMSFHGLLQEVKICKLDEDLVNREMVPFVDPNGGDRRSGISLASLQNLFNIV